MAGERTILAIDQGTTSTRAILFDEAGAIRASASESLEQIFPQPGWVEHDPLAIWAAALKVARSALSKTDIARVAGLGITNQRETSILWERATGAPVANAIVWQDRRTAPLCAELRAEGLADYIAETTGLLPDPYFSATKIAWMLDEISGVRARAEKGEICFGTIDSWLVFKLTGGAVHATDATNASRTMLYDIRCGRWDERLLERFAIPDPMMPDVHDCQSAFGTCDPAHFGKELPVLGVAGDQQAAAFGQACFSPGMIKATYGTGCFVLANTGGEKVNSANRMLATVGWQLAGKREYALEGSIFMAGATIQWLRDNLGLFSDVRETAEMARQADSKSGVYLVPAFQGLGAPWWDANARGAISGLSRATSANEIVRAGLESVAYQTVDLLEALAADMTAAGLPRPDTLRVDGGMTANGWLMQFLADSTAMPVEVAQIAETTALGAAYHAGLQAGVFGSQQDLAARWSPAKAYEPRMDESERATRYQGWREAVAQVRSGSQ